MKTHDVFDQTEVYEKQISPHIDEIKELCVGQDIPFFATFAVKSDEEGEISYKRNSLLPSELGLTMKDCEISSLITISKGGKAVPASEITELEFD